MPSIGVCLGPIAGSYITQTLGVRYIFIATSALGGIGSLVGILLLEETYASVIRSRLAERSLDLEKAVHAHTTNNESIWRTIWLNLSRPVILLTRSFICFILGLYLAL